MKTFSAARVSNRNFFAPSREKKISKIKRVFPSKNSSLRISRKNRNVLVVHRTSKAHAEKFSERNFAKNPHSDRVRRTRKYSSPAIRCATYSRKVTANKTSTVN
jgi:hypothetical protein